VSASSLQEVVLALDELEAVRLADLEGLYQERAAEQMNVSRQTFGRIIESARKKVAEALVEGKAIRVEGGVIEMVSTQTFRCCGCQNRWELPSQAGRPRECPRCKEVDIEETPRGSGSPPRTGRRRCCRRGRPSVSPRAAKVPESPDPSPGPTTEDPA